VAVLPADDITLLPDDVSGLLDASDLATFFTSEGELTGALLPGFLIEFARDEEDISTVGTNGLTDQAVDWSGRRCSQSASVDVWLRSLLGAANEVGSTRVYLSFRRRRLWFLG
jgi:hypothetical protein